MAMTSDEIRKVRAIDKHTFQNDYALVNWLQEIAYQLAVANEINLKNSTEAQNEMLSSILKEHLERSQAAAKQRDKEYFEKLEEMHLKLKTLESKIQGGKNQVQ